MDPVTVGIAAGKIRRIRSSETNEKLQALVDPSDALYIWSS